MSYIYKLIENLILYLESNLNNFLIGLISGIVASIFVLFLDRRLNEQRIKKQFIDLEGTYNHYDENRNLISDCSSKFKYVGRGKFSIDSSTPYGDWQGEVRFDQELEIFGSGSFKYTKKDEAGLMQLQIFRNTPEGIELAIYPFTLTHTFQKRNFYIIKKI